MAAIAAVPAASLPAPYAIVSSSSASMAAALGKRRRELFDEAVLPMTVTSAPQPKMAKTMIDVAADPANLHLHLHQPVPVPFKAAPIITVRAARGGNSKRPQMKYDPSVPMTKEETSAWRREQRRKRNRESAAACRKRQRDRISELEDVVAGWKAKFDNALLELRGVDGESAAELEGQLETIFAVAPTKVELRCSTPPAVADVVTSVTIPVAGGAAAYGSHVVSPCDRPKFIPPLVTSSSSDDGMRFPVLEDTFPKTTQGFLPVKTTSFTRVENKRQHLKEISRPAQSRLLSPSRWKDGWMDRLGRTYALLTQ